MQYTFGEKTVERYKGQSLPVWKSPKYEQSKAKAIEMIDSGKYGLNEADFWILMNTINSGSKMMYSGLIISHNGVLKINDNLPDDKKFKPESVTIDKDGFNNSLVFTYSNANQGIYEVGEVSKENCKNAYPYAMAFKRCFDRVVLKISKLAFSNIYSDVEADEFRERFEEVSKATKEQKKQLEQLINYGAMKLEEVQDAVKSYGKESFLDLDYIDAQMIIDVAEKRYKNKEMLAEQQAK